MGRTTLTDIARATGLSKFAVSRALSGKSGVSEETRRRVEDAAEELGYVRVQPSAPVRTLGLVFHDTDLINSELHLLIQSGVQSEAQRLGYQVRMRWTHLADDVEAFIDSCEGAIMVGPHDSPTYERAYALGKPLVRTGWVNPLEPVDFVGGTDHEAGGAIANHLLRLGHRAIAYVQGTPGYRGRRERFYGLREVLEVHTDVRSEEFTFEAEARFTEHLRAAQNRGFWPTAFFCAHDGLAVTVISELLRLGYRVPEDASVIGFGDFSAATQIVPALTTVRVHGRQIGAAAVRMVDDRLSLRVSPDVPLRTLIAGRIVERASCGVLSPGSAILREAGRAPRKGRRAVA